MGKLLKEQTPYLWLQEHEGEGKASCGCLLGYDADGSAQFTFCPTHEAAPDLLEACKMAKEFIKKLSDYYTPNPIPPNSDSGLDWDTEGVLDDAIKKATD